MGEIWQELHAPRAPGPVAADRGPLTPVAPGQRVIKRLYNTAFRMPARPSAPRPPTPPRK